MLEKIEQSLVDINQKLGRIMVLIERHGQDEEIKKAALDIDNGYEVELEFRERITSIEYKAKNLDTRISVLERLCAGMGRI